MYQILIVLIYTVPTAQHGYLAWPPNRSSLWRYGYDTPKNYNDNSLYCGGREVLEESNGRCGVCGDPYKGPREHEAGGIYASGIITERYPKDTKTIKVSVILTTNHKGFFDFRLCPHNNPNVPVRQECFDKFVLPIQEGQAKYQRMRYYLQETEGPFYNLTLEIPREIICSHCVLQWRYRTENSWGVEPNGTPCMGCGLQEEFYNCADISIGQDFSFDQTNALLPVSPQTRSRNIIQKINLSNQHTNFRKTVTLPKSDPHQLNSHFKILSNEQLQLGGFKTLQRRLMSPKKLSAVNASKDSMSSASWLADNLALNNYVISTAPSVVRANSSSATNDVTSPENEVISNLDKLRYRNLVDNVKNSDDSQKVTAGKSLRLWRKVLPSSEKTLQTLKPSWTSVSPSPQFSVANSDFSKRLNMANTVQAPSSDIMTDVDTNSIMYYSKEAFGPLIKDITSRIHSDMHINYPKIYSPAHKKYLLVRKVPSGLSSHPNNINDIVKSPNFIVRRQQIRLPKKLVRNMKSDKDLMKHIHRTLLN